MALLSPLEAARPKARAKSGPGRDYKEAGSSFATAGKSTGRGLVKTSTGTYKAAKKGVSLTAGAVAGGANALKNWTR